MCTNVTNSDKSVNLDSREFVPFTIDRLFFNPHAGRVRAYAVITVGPFTIKPVKVVIDPDVPARVEWPQTTGSGLMWSNVQINDPDLLRAIEAGLLRVYDERVTSTPRRVTFS